MLRKCSLLCFGAILFCSTTLFSVQPWHALFFTDPPKVAAADQPQPALVSVINSAKHSLKGAFFDIDSPPVIEAFINAASRGVSVELVVDDEATPAEVIEELRSRKVVVVCDEKSSLMHNKFLIIDMNYLWTGSLNITKNGFKKNNNNSLLIKSKELSQFYEYEFREMFQYKVFSNSKEQEYFPLPDNHYYTNVEGVPINCYFAPENDIENILIKRIVKAKSSVIFMAFSFTSDEIGEALIAAKKRGLFVTGVFESRGSGSKYAEYEKLKNSGIPVFKDASNGVMHHKVIIIDEETVITGSYNFSKNAAKRNDENLLILTDKGIAAQYKDEFRKLYNQSKQAKK